jgi:hypothetical protein
VYAPHAPWTLVGECFAGVARWRGGRTGSRVSFPPGVRRVPGPVLVAGARYTDSPVGPYVELLVAEPARLGIRPGVCATTMVVSSPDARVGGRLNWGFPKEVGTLRWSSDGDDHELVWEERGVVIRAHAVGTALPLLVPLRALQRRSDGPVVVPARLRGRARRARIEMKVPSGDALSGVDGAHHGVTVSSMRVVLDPARLPSGLASTLLAPLRAPEPALSSGPRSGD